MSAVLALAPGAVRVYLDDVRDTPAGWLRWKTYEGAVAWMQLSGCPDHVSFDFDLDWKENERGEWMPLRPGDIKGPTGLDVAKWMIARDKAAPGWMPRNFTYAVHSQNQDGARLIDELMRRYLRRRQH